MSESKIYRLNFWRLIKQAFFNCLFIAGFVFILSGFVPTLSLGENLLNILFFIILIGVLAVPSLWITCNYFFYSINTQIEISSQGITVKNRWKEERFIDKSNIVGVNFYSNDYSDSKLPWLFHQHVIIEVKNGSTIVLTSYHTDIDLLRYDSIFKSVTRGIKHEKTVAIFKPVRLKNIK